MLNSLLIETIKKVFFSGMLKGYAGTCQKTEIPGLPGSRFITSTYEIGGHVFVFTDMYYVTKLSDFSYGITAISYDGDPVWCMTYGGMYPKEVIPFLKDVLKDNYERGNFNGGRGHYYCSNPEKYPNLVYQNERSHYFDKFSGHEEIRNVRGGYLVGYHDYHGSLMLPK